METSKALFLLIGFLTLDFSEAQNKVLLTVFYESYCPYSKAYITSQLSQAYRQLSGIMEIEFIPISYPQGNAVTCQHGNDECITNRYAGCALGIYGYRDPKAVNFIFCLERQNSPRSAIQSCAQNARISFDFLQTCYKAQRSTNLINIFYQRKQKITNTNISVKLFPWILVNGGTNQDLQRAVRQNTFQVVCRYYQGRKPNVCGRSRK